jgi:hypothetical protein
MHKSILSFKKGENPNLLKVYTGWSIDKLRTYIGCSIDRERKYMSHNIYRSHTCWVFLVHDEYRYMLVTGHLHRLVIGCWYKFTVVYLTVTMWQWFHHLTLIDRVVGWGKESWL